MQHLIACHGVHELWIKDALQQAVSPELRTVADNSASHLILVLMVGMVNIMILLKMHLAV